jgi:hypothetical protein
VLTSDPLICFGIHYSRDIAWHHLVGVQKLFNVSSISRRASRPSLSLGFLSPLMSRSEGDKDLDAALTPDLLPHGPNGH